MPQIIAPIAVIALLLQSYFWVPTYEEQTRGNPERFNEYITASIGDASILNPILSADASSSEIGGKVFEGLIDYDQNLHFRGRLAESWKVYEAAYFHINEAAALPVLDQADAGTVTAVRINACISGSSRQLARNLRTSRCQARANAAGFR